jgi:hypothetical protein
MPYSHAVSLRYSPLLSDGYCSMQMGPLQSKAIVVVIHLCISVAKLFTTVVNGDQLLVAMWPFISSKLSLER